MTQKIAGATGKSKNGKDPGKVKWGTARKCINLLLRSIVYNGFIWDKYKLKSTDFDTGGLMDKLELPLDSYAVTGIIHDCKNLQLDFDRKKYPNFRIIYLNERDKTESEYYQNKALEIGKRKNICRIDLDLEYWRKKKENL